MTQTPSTSSANVTPAAQTPLLSPLFMQSLDRLDVLSRKILSGKLQGDRRSKQRGQSVEFADYRPYVAGDDLRFIDWNLYARLDKLFLKLFVSAFEIALAKSVLHRNHDALKAQRFLDEIEGTQLCRLDHR